MHGMQLWVFSSVYVTQVPFLSAATASNFFNTHDIPRKTMKSASCQYTSNLHYHYGGMLTALRPSEAQVH
jgi:hypothetical protein